MLAADFFAKHNCRQKAPFTDEPQTVSDIAAAETTTVAATAYATLTAAADTAATVTTAAAAAADTAATVTTAAASATAYYFPAAVLHRTKVVCGNF